MRNKFTFVILLILTISISFGQSDKMTDLEHPLIEKAKEYRKANNDSSFYYINQAINKGIAEEDCQLFTHATYWRGGFYYAEGKNDAALEDLYSASIYAGKCDEKGIEATCYVLIGEITGNNLNDREKAINYFRKSLSIFKEIDDSEGMASCYNEIGLFTQDKDSSLYFHRLSLKIDTEIGNMDGMADSYHNIASTHTNLGNLDSAYFYFLKTLEIDESNNDVFNMAYTLNSIGEVLTLDGNYSVALYYFKKAWRLAKPYNYLNQLQFSYKNMANVHHLLGQDDSAFYYQKLFTDCRDSLMNETTSMNISEMETKYQTERKELENIALEEKNSRQEVELDSRRKTTALLLIGLGLAVILIVSTLISYSRKKKLNAQLANQNDTLNEQKALIEHKNNEILDSITYAKRIQSAILPPLDQFSNLLPKSFVLYLPKDIVAGDFYWLEETDDEILFAAADCTGHGVPGAMVSVVCHNALNRSVREFGLRDPGQILNKTREIVMEEFESSSIHVQDGMDIALCALNKTSKEIKYAGAHNALWILRNGADSIEEHKANKQPIGHFVNAHDFDTHKIQLQTGDRIYLFSDGFADQFGGPNNKKYKGKKFKNKIVELRQSGITDQSDLLKYDFEQWKGDHEQLDDICVIGVEI